MNNEISNISLISWNINGNFSERSLVVDQFVNKYNVICLQEHFITEAGINLLNLWPSYSVFSVPAKRSSPRGRPSGGIATLVSNRLACEVYENSDNFLAIRLDNLLVINVYLPTDYRDDKSDSAFAISAAKLARCLKKAERESLECIIVGDFNCNLEVDISAQNSRCCILIGILENRFTIHRKNQNFSYIHQSGSTSNLDHIVSSSSLPVREVLVLPNSFTSDHFPVQCIISRPTSFSAANNSSIFTQRWHEVPVWRKIDKEKFQDSCDLVLSKIRVPFDLLMKFSHRDERDARLRLNIYYAELTHALLFAESQGVPKSRARQKTQEKGWSSNPLLQLACDRATFWYGIWKECGRPHSGVVKEIRVASKRRFGKELARHRVQLKSELSEKVIKNPNLLWKMFDKKESAGPESDIPSLTWINYYLDEFSAPKQDLNISVQEKLSSLLSSIPDTDFIVTQSQVASAVRRLKKKKSAGIDRVSALHLSHCSPTFMGHLTLLFQMIFTTGLVPSAFSTGSLRPVPKKGKSTSECASFRPITVAPTLCKIFELLVIDEIQEKCWTPPSQFGFQRGLGCGHAISALASVLIDADESKESIVIGLHDVCRAYDSLLHDQLILDMGKRGVQKDILLPIKDMYDHLQAELLLPGHGRALTEYTPDVMLSYRGNPVVPVKKGARQGSVTSPCAFNNCIIEPQSTIETTCIARGIDVTMIAYADDILNPSRTVAGTETTFSTLQSNYSRIGLEFNPQKSDILLFNWRQEEVSSLRLGELSVAPVSKIIYLGLPIGKDLKTTRSLLIDHLRKRLAFAYSRVVSSKIRFNRLILARLYNAVSLPHFLYLSPFWRIFPEPEKRKLRSTFFKYAKFLLRLPPWTRNSHLVKNFKIADPTAAIIEQIKRYNEKVSSHPWYRLLRQ